MSFIRHRRATSPNKFECRNVYSTNRIDVASSKRTCFAHYMIREKYIIIYRLNPNSEMERFAKELSEKTGCKIVRMSYYLNHLKEQGKMIYTPTVNQFLSLINYANYVITEKYRTIKKPFFQPQIRSNSPKPQSPRTCLIKRACTSKVQKRRESVLEQNGSGDTEQ